MVDGILSTVENINEAGESDCGGPRPGEEHARGEAGEGGDEVPDRAGEKREQHPAAL